MCVVPCMCAQRLRELVTSCWDADAEKRPTFEEIVIILEEMLKVGADETGRHCCQPCVKGVGLRHAAVPLLHPGCL